MKALLTLLLVVLVGLPTNAELRAPRFVACRVGAANLPAHCGTVDVYENRAARAGRTIALNVIEVDAVHRAARAIFWNPGGPGGDDARDVPAIVAGVVAKELMALHDTYDLVFVDVRGTGKSHPLECDLADPHRPAEYFARLFPDAPLRACRHALAAHADLDAYTTDATADDLDDVRAALGYRRIVLDGGSYGTRLFLDYARRYPARVESLVLEGVAPPGSFLIPLDFVRGAQTAMDDLIRDCAHDAACRRSYPRFGPHFTALVRRFERGGIRMTVTNAATKRATPVTLSKEVFADQLRHILYSADTAAYVPYVTEQAYRGNDAPLAHVIDVASQSFGLAMGLNLSITCAEDIPFITQARIAGVIAGSFGGATRIRAQQRACDVWHVSRVPVAFEEPVRSIAPVLMISGADDPATPPGFGRAALRFLPNGRQIVVPHAGHDAESACTDALIVAFVRARDVTRIDGGRCTATAHRPPFALSLRGFGN